MVERSSTSHARPQNMDSNEPRRVRCDEFLDASGIERVGSRMDVAKDRRDAQPVQCMDRCRESERRHDDFPGQSERSHRDLQRHRSIAHRDHVADTDSQGNPSLEFLDVLTVVRQPSAIK